MKALTHISPRWIYNHDCDEDVLTWGGKMRVVRSRKRMRRLKRRGVPMMHLGVGNGTAAQQQRGIHGSPGNLKPFGPWAWFESFETRDARIQARRERADARFFKRNPLVNVSLTQAQVVSWCRAAVDIYRNIPYISDPAMWGTPDATVNPCGDVS